MSEEKFEEFSRLLKPGQVWRLYINDGNIHNGIRHIRAIVDDRKIVWREWSKWKRCWYYHMDDTYLWWLFYEKNQLTMKRGGTR